MKKKKVLDSFALLAYLKMEGKSLLSQRCVGKVL